MNHYVYEIENKITGKKYIGKRSCKCPIEDDKYMGSSALLKIDIEKQGIENFKKKILKVCSSKEESHKYETAIIKYLTKKGNLDDYYNIMSNYNYPTTTCYITVGFANMIEEYYNADIIEDYKYYFYYLNRAMSDFTYILLRSKTKSDLLKILRERNVKFKRMVIAETMRFRELQSFSEENFEIFIDVIRNTYDMFNKYRRYCCGNIEYLDVNTTKFFCYNRTIRSMDKRYYGIMSKYEDIKSNKKNI